jgi:hypothetical protein
MSGRDREAGARVAAEVKNVIASSSGTCTPTGLPDPFGKAKCYRDAVFRSSIRPSVFTREFRAAIHHHITADIALRPLEAGRISRKGRGDATLGPSAEY